MTPKLAAYIGAGYALSPDERLEAARMLRLSVDQDADSDPAEIDASWRDEIGSHVDDILAGMSSSSRRMRLTGCCQLSCRRSPDDARTARAP